MSTSPANSRSRVSSSEAVRAAAYRAQILGEFAPGVADLGPTTVASGLQPFAGEAVVDLDAQVPAVLSSVDLQRWAAAANVTLIGAACWAVALDPPNDNLWLARTHARESDMAQVRSWTAEVRALAEARRLVELRLAPSLPLGATRRVLLHIRHGAEADVTAATVEALERRRTALSGTIRSEAIEGWIPHARPLAAALQEVAADDFRAWAFLAKLTHAAVSRRQHLDVGALLPDAAAAQFATELIAGLELDRAIYDFAFHWADDRALEPFVSYRGVRLDGIAVNLILRRYGHPGYQGS